LGSRTGRTGLPRHHPSGGCDLTRLKIDDLCVGGRLRDRATIIQRKTGRAVQFELTEQTRASIEDWLSILKIREGRFLFPSRVHDRPHISTRQYARIVHEGVRSAGLDDAAYGTHSMRRTKAAQIYKKTGNLRAVQLLLGHTKLESTVRYLGIEVEDAPPAPRILRITFPKSGSTSTRASSTRAGTSCAKKPSPGRRR
jgi:site-specific recombinase XerD